MGQQGCNNSGREQLLAALPAQLDAQGWDVQQAGLGEGAAADISFVFRCPMLKRKYSWTMQVAEQI
ncbi:hypothetical protein HaLaN_19532 [Haematococcus lacustris]|uniref:Uncharacterized protein n=1 Tax=Haematococcus lacustris TaxID=44745 RepID=A0A699ZV00_HAELA|nr:hypothetical protein HaLaN_19532 [Haematococcus lacustris]